MYFQVFNPAFGSNQVIAAAAASAAVSVNQNDDQVRIINTGANIAYVRAYWSATVPAPAATVADLPIPPGMASTLTKGQVNDRIAYISAAGTTLNIMTGNGV